MRFSGIFEMVISVQPWLEIGGDERAAQILSGRIRGIEPRTRWVAADGDVERAEGLGIESGVRRFDPAVEGEMVAVPLVPVSRIRLSNAKAEDGGGADGEQDDDLVALRAESEAFYHRSVMPEEVMAALKPGPGRWFFDGTVGGGGHTEDILRSGGNVIGCDQDTDAIAYASERLKGYGDRVRLVHANFSDLDRILSDAGHPQVDGILLDLGISSFQIDAPGRGFSFMRPGPLDMRMNPEGAETAADLVNYAEPAELARIFREYGEEPAAQRIVQAVLHARENSLITTTAELAAIVESVIPRTSGRHPATRIFQALRIAVNDELRRLTEALEKSAGCLNSGGVLAVISFHSLEDRIVKRFMREHSEKTIDRPEWPNPKPNPNRYFELLRRKPLEPEEDEVSDNPRARSAKLRVAVRI